MNRVGELDQDNFDQEVGEIKASMKVIHRRMLNIIQEEMAKLE